MQCISNILKDTHASASPLQVSEDLCLKSPLNIKEASCKTPFFMCQKGEKKRSHFDTHVHLLADNFPA